MARLERPRGLKITFKPSEKQYELWNALQPNRCDKCGGKLEMKPNGFDKSGNPVYKPVCSQCGTDDIPEQILGGGSAGGGKACSLQSTVCTPFGFRVVRDLRVGDIISNPITGGQQRIVYLHPIETRQYYRVKFVDGTYVDCSDHHLWQLHESRKTSKRTKIYGDEARDSIWTAEQMYEWFRKKDSGMYKGSHLIIPLCAPIQFTCAYRTTHPLTIPPYILGALIGNGCMTDSFVNQGKIGFCTMDKEVEEEFENAGYDMSWYKQTGRAKNYTIESQPLINHLKAMGLTGHKADSKFIPKQYKYGTIQERISLMQGLMDTDGYVDDRGHMSYTTISKQLADDVAFVVRSLGGVATITDKIGQYKTSDGEVIQCSTAYTVYFRTKINPELVHVTRKKNRATYKFNGGVSELGKRIVDVEKIGMVEGRCITVSDPRGLFVTDDFTVTHNSYLGCCWLTASCMQFEGIRMVVARKVRKTLLETTWCTLLDVLEAWGLKRDVHYHVNNLAYTITFWNGSTIMAMDLTPSPQDPDFNSLGSLEITGGFIDEVSEVSEKAVEVLASRIRYKVADTFIVGKLFMSTNPCLTWVRSTFVIDDDGNPVVLQKGYRYIPFSLFDNPDEKFRAIYYNKLSKLRNKADRERLLYGNWLFVSSNKMSAYWNFDGDKHLVQNLKEKYYDPVSPLILSFDFNVNPYMSCLPIQINYDSKVIMVFPEYIGYPKDKLNNTPAFTRWISKKLSAEGHLGGILVTGDPAGLARSTQTEEGVNNFTIAIKNMANDALQPKLQLLNKQPALTTRLEFVNQIFEGYEGWKVQIDVKCRRLTEDFVYQKKNPDGTKEKKKVLNDTGERVEKYGHLSDCFDYALTYYLSTEYLKYKSGSVETVVTVDPGATVYGDFDY